MANFESRGIWELGGSEKVHSDFEEINAYVYHSAHGALLDIVIWCLGPYVDETREYGPFRLWLAWATRLAVRRCLVRVEDDG